MLVALAEEGVPDAVPAPVAAEEGDEVVVAAPTGVPPRVVPERWTPPPEVVDAVRAARARPLPERIDAASRAFLGLPYLNDAAGEMAGPDPDPPARYDAFDCLTFVEEVLALAIAPDPLYAPAIRDALRYRGAASYETRRHFMEAQWIPDAIANGLLVDVTDRVGRARTITKEVTPDTWRHWRRRALFKLPDALLPLGAWSLRFLDLAEAAEAAARIPPGAVIVTLRRDKGAPIVTTHISMVVPGSGTERVWMRHATRMGTRKVRDDRLPWYATHLRDYVNWPALGVTVLMPREQGPRVSALASPALPPPFPDAEGELPVFDARPIPPFPAPPP
ncbi:MAG: N-acetylmuramoyl-L-alanine amidase-like domain-containing protein [Myxococcota bacterium]